MVVQLSHASRTRAHIFFGKAFFVGGGGGFQSPFVFAREMRSLHVSHAGSSIDGGQSTAVDTTAGTPGG